MRKIQRYLVGTILFILAVFGYLIFKRLQANVLETLTPYVLLLTLLAIGWYSLETRSLRVQSKEHMELSLKPHLMTLFQRGEINLYNIGNGPAVHIWIDDAIVPLPKMGQWRLRFVCPDVIKKDERLPIKIKILTEDGKHEPSSMLPGFYTPPLATETIDIDVHFENLIGKKYVYNLKIGKDMPSNIDPIDLLLQFLKESYPKGINNSGCIPAIYVDPKERMKLLKYCIEKGLVSGAPIETDQEGIIDWYNIRITSEGIDYLKSK
jgi:hypothetical protein